MQCARQQINTAAGELLHLRERSGMQGHKGLFDLPVLLPVRNKTEPFVKRRRAEIALTGIAMARFGPPHPPGMRKQGSTIRSSARFSRVLSSRGSATVGTSTD